MGEINKSVSIKKHPSVISKNSKLFDDFEILESELPIEFLMNKSTILIGLGSSALKDSTKLCSKVISVIEILNWKSQELKIQLTKNFYQIQKY